MSLTMTLTLLGGTVTACAAARAGASAVRARTASRVDTLSVAMPELGGRMRKIRVYLPAGYAEGRTAYPVLYLQDAQQLFSPGPFGDWLADEHLDSLIGHGRLGGLIVVGVDNSERRWDEYGPWVNTHMHAWVPSSWSQPVQGGEGDAYVRFLTATLKPMIDARYRTLPDRDHTGIGGSSMGALIALHAGITRPDVFSKVMAMSTAVWFAENGGPWLSDNRLLREVQEKPAPTNVHFYLDVGTKERSRDTDPDVLDGRGRPVSYPRAYLEGSEAVAAALRVAGVPADRFRFRVDEGGIHNESAWSARFEDAITWLYQ
jgi:metallo-beta-lactamase class B